MQIIIITICSIFRANKITYNFVINIPLSKRIKKKDSSKYWNFPHNDIFYQSILTICRNITKCFSLDFLIIVLWHDTCLIYIIHLKKNIPRASLILRILLRIQKLCQIAVECIYNWKMSSTRFAIRIRTEMIYAVGPCLKSFWGVKAHIHTFICSLRDFDDENSNHVYG